MDRRSESQRQHDRDSEELGNLLSQVFAECLLPAQSEAPPAELAHRVADWEGLLEKLNTRRQALFVQAEELLDRQAHHQRRLAARCVAKSFRGFIVIPFALLLMVARALFFSEEVRQEMRALKQEAEVAGQQREKLLLTSQKAENTMEQQEIALSSEVARDQLGRLRAFLNQETRAVELRAAELDSRRLRSKEILVGLRALTQELRTDMERRNYQSLFALARSRALAEAFEGSGQHQELLARIQHMVILRERFRDIAHKLRIIEIACVEIQAAITSVVTGTAGTGDTQPELFMP